MGLIGSILKTTAKVAIGVPLLVVGGLIQGAGDAARTQRDAQKLSNGDLAEKYLTTTSASERAGLQAEINRRNDK